MNSITKITNLENFTNLDMIDLHDNNISGAIDFQTCFGMLKNLKTLNLSNNAIEEVNINCAMSSLVEINLRHNRIKTFKINSPNLSSLAKMFLSTNQIKTFDKVLTSTNMRSKLTELTFENNPVEKDANILEVLKEKFPSLNSSSL